MKRTTSPGVRIPALLLCALPLLARAQELQPPDSLRQSAEQLTRTRLAVGSDPARTVVTAGNLDTRLRLPRCTRPLEGVFPTTVRDAARLTVGVRCTDPVWTVYVPVMVETELEVLVLRASAARNASLGSQDVEKQVRRIPGVAAAYLTDPAQLAGQHLRMPAGPGTVLTRQLFQPDILIRRGQRVTLVASAGGIEVRAQGEAIADASPGGRVRVLNLSSRRIVEGDVESPDRVRVTL